jgi:hypothetical protein
MRVTPDIGGKGVRHLPDIGRPLSLTVYLGNEKIDQCGVLWQSDTDGRQQSYEGRWHRKALPAKCMCRIRRVSIFACA